jgi:hypothetical protein
MMSRTVVDRLSPAEAAECLNAVSKSPVVGGGDVAVWLGELAEPHTKGQLRVRALDPELVWLTYAHEPWRPR